MKVNTVKCQTKSLMAYSFYVTGKNYLDKIARLLREIFFVGVGTFMASLLWHSKDLNTCKKSFNIIVYLLLCICYVIFKKCLTVWNQWLLSSYMRKILTNSEYNCLMRLENCCSWDISGKFAVTSTRPCAIHDQVVATIVVKLL